MIDIKKREIMVNVFKDNCLKTIGSDLAPQDLQEKAKEVLLKLETGEYDSTIEHDIVLGCIAMEVYKTDDFDVACRHQDLDRAFYMMGVPEAKENLDRIEERMKEEFRELV